MKTIWSFINLLNLSLHSVLPPKVNDSSKKISIIKLRKVKIIILSKYSPYSKFATVSVLSFIACHISFNVEYFLLFWVFLVIYDWHFRRRQAGDFAEYPSIWVCLTCIFIQVMHLLQGYYYVNGAVSSLHYTGST